MKFSKLEQSATGTKDIGAFYGVNRTNRINDYQMSDMKNVDCESFPYLATRRARKLFYDENKMAVICHDTDITDDYKVTGVTEDGNFVYRGKYFDVNGEISGNAFMCEHLGDYVFFPNRQYVRTQYLLSDNKEEVKCFSPVYGDYSARPLRQKVLSYGHIETTRARISFSGAGGRLVFDFLDSYNRHLPDGITSGSMLAPGSVYSFKFYYGETSYKPDWVVSPSLDEVFLVINDLRLYGRKEKGGDLEEYALEEYDKGSLYEGYVEIMFDVYNVRGERVNCFDYINQNKEAFKNILLDGIDFGDAEVTVSVGYLDTYRFIVLELGSHTPLMCMGASYGGRLFACDMFGIDIFYSSGSGIEGEKYCFVPNASLGGAGAVSCADSGKWTALKSYNGALYAFKKNGMYRIYSSDGLNFYMDKVADIGAVSSEAVCIVSDVMYFLSETGLYRFTGTYPEELPDNLGRRYTGGVLGGYDNKVYCSLSYSGGNELIVYDAQVSAYGVHDEFDAVNFVTYGGKLYGLDASSGYVYEMSGERESLEFSINTRKFFLGFDKKAINGIRLYFDYQNQPGENFEVLVSYDGGEWEPCFKPVTSGKLKYVPIKFKKCDELSVSIRGTGVFTLKGMTLSLYSSGDIKQNR